MGASKAPKERPDGSDLTAREREVLNLLQDGRSQQAAAASLYISIRTIQYHLHNIYQKLDVHSLLQALNAIEGRELPMEERQD